ncbi:PRC-barrel domain-containing protein [Bradyrhizobium sp. BRP22]|uniref:PRC-barrel domain-containing protein n=1 Tax=Bradyrhizobium sp. BRP22 TaxID=2793821 RepID=UPI001CD47E01|nr:PRC-barrel domain-containing protein [Bradyrhizobium sp. BRP22]MCA1454327.1 PRC-barrel domain-containing protein [Bradyrhizobium sp. BRP22]
MLAKYTITGLAASALLASVAFAQTPSTATGDRPSTAETTTTTAPSSFKGNWRASKMSGLNVYNDSNESIGSINDMLMDKSGNIKAVVIGVGGFLGVGEHLVAVPFEKVKFVNEPVAYTGASNTGAKPSGGAGTGTSTTTGAAPSSTSTSKPNPWYPDHAVYSATKDELKAMPEFKYATD